MSIRTNKLLPIALAVALPFVVAACVTHEGRVFTSEASPEEALKTRLQLARSYIGEQNWEDAKRNLRVAAEIDPNSPEVHEAFALVYQSIGEYELAEESFKKAISLQKNFSRARNNYAAFLASQERYGEAEKQLEYVVKDSLYTARPQAYINLGLCRVQLFDPQGAEEAFVRSLSMDRRSPIALLELAQLRFDAKDYDNAERYYGTYRTVVRQQTARGLWPGVRIARATGDRDAEGSYALALANRYPDSPEFEAYSRTPRSE